MKKFLEPFNMFGYKINFTYKRSKSFHSLFGLFISFVVYIVTAFLLYYFSKDFLENTNPKINYKQKQISPLNISLANFFLSEKLDIEIKFGKLDKDHSSEKNEININNNQSHFQLEKFMEEKNYSISNFIRSQIVIREHLVNEEEDDTESITLFQTILDFYNFDEEDYKNDSITLSQIIDKNQPFYVCQAEKYQEDQCEYNQHFETFENFFFTLEKKIQIRFRIFINHTLIENEKLKIESLNFKYYSSIIDKTIDVDERDFFSNYTYFKDSEYVGDLIEQQYSRHEFLFGLYNVSDDTGAILPNIKNVYGLVRESDNKYNKRYKGKSGFLYSLIRFNGVKVEYNRIYKKVQNILADIGGIFSSMVVIGSLLIENYNQKYFSYKNMNFLFENVVDKEGNEKSLKALGVFKDLSKNRNETTFNKDDSNDKSSNYFITSKNNIENLNQKNKEFIDIIKVENKVNNNNNVITEVDNHVKPTNQNEPTSNESRNLCNLSDLKNFKNSGLQTNYLKINPNENKSNLVDFNNPSNLELSNFNRNHNSDVQGKISFKENKITELIKINSNGTNNTNNFFRKAEIKGNKKYVKFSTYEYFISFICFKKLKNKKIIDKEETFIIGENKIDRYLNVLNYFDFYEDFEKFKSLILNEHQNFAVQFIKRRSANDLSEVNYSEKLSKTINYFKAIQGNFSNLDEKILCRSSSNFIELF